MKEEDINFDKLEKFEKLPDSALTEISEIELFGSTISQIENNTNIDESEINEAKKENQADRPQFAFEQKEGEGSTINLASFLSSELVMEAIDALLPLLFVYGLSAMKISIQKKQLQLTQKEKDIIMPLVEDCLKELNILIKSPFVALGIMLLIFYGSKSVEFGIKAKETKKAETDGKPATPVKDARGRKKGTTKEVIEKRALDEKENEKTI